MQLDVVENASPRMLEECDGVVRAIDYVDAAPPVDSRMRANLERLNEYTMLAHQSRP